MLNALHSRVVKLGGNELDCADWLARCALQLAKVAPLVVVHGGGQAITNLSRQLGLPVEKRDGLRVTTPEIAAVVEMVLSGPVNRQVVAALRAAGIDAIGLSGADGALLTARLAEGGLGHVGEIIAVRAPLLEDLLRSGLTPVIAPIAPAAPSDANPHGVPYNVNADEAAAAIAGALGAAELLFVSDVPGVSVGGMTQRELAATELEHLIATGVARDGMAAKLRAAGRALRGGARTARIGDLTLFDSPSAGTRIAAAAAQPA